jgi:mannosyl-oligosaccharide alpha-1,2-mannosidase
MILSKSFFALLPTLALAAPAPQVQNANSPTPPQAYRTNQGRADAIKEAFMHSWSGYYRYAFPHDELRPLSNAAGDSRNGWGASAVDALSTAIIMGLAEPVDQILDHVPKINFDVAQGSVSLFETTIRYLGGFLSGYDFLGPGGPARKLVKPEKVRYPPKA